ncbi:helix-turn-helix domain-containing protein, partial [Bacillus mycoides]
FFMAKFSLEVKLEAIQDYLEGKESYRSIGNRIGTHHKSIMKWVGLYKKYGIEGLRSRYTNYSVQFKMDVLNFMNETGTSLLETAVIYNIPDPSTILQWKKTLEKQGIDALYSKKRGRP